MTYPSDEGEAWEAGHFGLSPEVAREMEVDEYIADGRVTVHESSEAILAHLDRLDTDTDTDTDTEEPSD